MSLVLKEKDVLGKHKKVSPAFLHEKMLMHRVIMSVGDSQDDANQDENELGMSMKAQGFHSIAQQLGGDAHKRTAEGAMEGYVVLVDFYGRYYEPCSLQNLGVCFNPVRFKDSRSLIAIRKAEDELIRREQANSLHNATVLVTAPASMVAFPATVRSIGLSLESSQLDPLLPSLQLATLFKNF